jgi:2-hydroxychromene-2-carboxylate isomerase
MSEYDMVSPEIRGRTMSAGNTIDFWFTVGSTYTYLTVSRLHNVEAATGVRFRWRPFNARAIMQEMNNIPFATKPIKLAYMWRDIERRALKYGLPIKVPAPYPLKNFDLASRVAVLAEMEGWCPDYLRASYKRWFVESKEVGIEPNLSESLSEIGQDPDRVIEAANAEPVERSYDNNTREATRWARPEGADKGRNDAFDTDVDPTPAHPVYSTEWAGSTGVRC